MVIVDDVEQLPGVGGDSILPSLLGVKDFYMIVLKCGWFGIKINHTLWYTTNVEACFFFQMVAQRNFHLSFNMTD